METSHPRSQHVTHVHASLERLARKAARIAAEAAEHADVHYITSQPPEAGIVAPRGQQ